MGHIWLILFEYNLVIRFGINVVKLPKNIFLAIKLNTVTSYGDFGHFTRFLSYFDAKTIIKVFFIYVFLVKISVEFAFFLSFMNYVTFKHYLVNQTKIDF